MKAEEVVRYLQDNPGFFEDYAELLAQIYIPHPHGGRAIPIAERQILTLREKSKMLEGKLAELIQFGEENDAIGEKMHRLCLALFPAGDLHAMLQALYYNLREDFAVPHAALRVWGSDPSAPTAGGPEFAPVSDELRQLRERPGASLSAAATRTPRSRPGSATRRRSCARSPASRCATAARPASACWRWRAKTPRVSTRRWARSISSAWANS